MSTHILSVIVENKPGVLARASGLFARRGFNIDSLAVGPTQDAAISHMTIALSVESTPLEQIVKQLDKLVNVLSIVDLEYDETIETEMDAINSRLQRLAGLRPVTGSPHRHTA
jgi:acetolactate synthase-1/3 small subunit